MKWYLFSFIGVLTWMIVGCQPAATPEKLSVPAPTAPSQVAASVQPGAALTPIQTPTAPITSTRVEATSTATPDIPGTIVATVESRLYDAYLSPDGRWRTEIMIYGECAPIPGTTSSDVVYELLKLVHIDTGVETIADSQLYGCVGLGASGLAGVFWSPNSRYFYYTDARDGGPDGCGYWERPLIRLDVTDLSVKDLGAGPRSPDGTKLATWQGQALVVSDNSNTRVVSQDQELVVWDSNEGEMVRVPPMAPDAQAGPIAWSPDSQALVYVQFTDYCLVSESSKSYVVRLDLPDSAPTLLLESETPSFIRAVWDTPDELRLLDMDGKEWIYRFSTQEVRPLS